MEKDKKEKKEKKQFKAESKKLLDLMIHSIYTNKEIFLRELLSNASDAMDKLAYRSLTDTSLNINRDNLEIRIDIDKEKRKLIISDNGCGMTKEELENNLGTIAKSGSLDFKKLYDKEKKDAQDIDIIGQFGVGFYSAFMVSDKIKVESKSVDSEDAYIWKSEGADGYEIKKGKRKDTGTTITLSIKEDTEEENYSEFLDTYHIQSIVKKYSDYIRYPIKMMIEHSKLKEGSKDEYEKEIVEETVNSMIPLWKKAKKDITEEEYQNFYSSKFFDYDKPLKTIHTSVEGQCSYNALLYIPSHLPYDFYTKEYEKGLQLYSSGVLIMDKCADLLPDYFSFVKGLVDTEDISLNISREILQQNHSLKLIAKSIEKKIKKELETMLKEDRETYESFFKTFGMQIKFGVYADYGVHKDDLKDLLMFYSSTEKKLVTLDEYVSRMKEGQENIYYACGESTDKVDNMPQVEGIKEKGYEILYLTEYVDEFALQTLTTYNAKKFMNVSNDTVDLDNDEEKKELEKANTDAKDMFEVMKKVLENNNISDIKFTHRLKKHPVCLTTEGELSASMEKVLNALPNDNKVNAKMILEINEKHPISEKIKTLYKDNKDELEKYTKILYAQARLIEGLPIDNPTEISTLICDVISEN
ncbi:MAG: molecular chaperone HtpG [Bacilli bacterium]|nr:molecular chaperone HtpG [Bacilli bacterium]MDY4996786.1 molecular chaperone HtpG [Bacilli bacterium]